MANRRRIYPMPVEGIIDHPRVEAMSCAALGMLTRLLLHYWKTDCADMDTGLVNLFRLCRPHTNSWSKEKTVIREVFISLQPELKAYMIFRKQKKSIINEIGRDSKLRARLKARATEASAEQARLQAHTLPVLEPTAIPRTPDKNTAPRPRRRD